MNSRELPFREIDGSYFLVLCIAEDPSCMVKGRWTERRTFGRLMARRAQSRPDRARVT